MESKELYQCLLGLDEPWTVERVELDMNRQHVDRQRLEQVGKAASRFNPWQARLPHPMLRTRYTGWGSMQVGQELTAIQVSPNPFSKVVVHRKLLSAFRTTKARTTRMLNIHINLLPFHIQFDSSNSPWLVESKQALIQFFAFHRTSLLQDMRYRLRYS